MSKVVLYSLALCVTYSTLDKGVFRTGVGYTPDQLGDHLNDTNDAGALYFEEVGEADIIGENKQTSEVKVTKKSVGINKKTVAPEGGGGEVGGVDPDKVTV